MPTKRPTRMIQEKTKEKAQCQHFRDKKVANPRKCRECQKQSKLNSCHSKPQSRQTALRPRHQLRINLGLAMLGTPFKDSPVLNPRRLIRKRWKTSNSAMCRTI